MNKEQKKKRITDFFKNNPNQCFGAVKIDNKLGFDDSKKNHSGPTHQVLKELVNKGILEKCEKGKGFRWKQPPAEMNLIMNEKENKEILIKIQKHLKAIVNLQIIKMAEHVAKEGGFDKQDGNINIKDLGAAGDYQASLIDRAYRDLAVKEKE